MQGQEETGREPKGESAINPQTLVVRAPGMQDDALRISAVGRVSDSVQPLVLVLVDTGAQVSLVRRGLFPPEVTRDSEKTIRLLTAGKQPLQGGTREVPVDLIFKAISEDTGESVELKAPSVLYEADITDDVIVSYTWLGERELEVVPKQHGLRGKVGATRVWVPGDLTALVSTMGASSPTVPMEICRPGPPSKKALDLFSGTGSASKVLKAHGFEVVTVDNDPRWSADIREDILSWDYATTFPQPGTFDIIVASPPCTEYSLALTTRERHLEEADRLVKKTLEIIDFYQPRCWWIETPATGLLARSPLMAGYPHLDCDQCQFGDYGYQKPTRFFGSEHLKALDPVLCDRRTCASLVEDLDGKQRVRRHKNRQGGHHGYVHKKLAYRLPPALVEYVTGLVPKQPETKCCAIGARWRSQQYAVQAARVQEITDRLQVQPTVDAFSQAETSRCPRWWGPGSPEAEDAFSQSWGGGGPVGQPTIQPVSTDFGKIGGRQSPCSADPPRMAQKGVRPKSLGAGSLFSAIQLSGQSVSKEKWTAVSIHALACAGSVRLW